MKQKLSLLVVLLLSAVIQAFAAGGNSTFYYTTNVKATGNGLIYAGENNTAPDESDYVTEKTMFSGSTTTQTGQKTIYLWALPTQPYTTVTWTASGRQIEITQTGDYWTAVVEGNQSQNTGYTITANFVTQTQTQTPVITGTDGQTLYWPSIEVTITAPDEGAAIYYTTDGTDPTTSSTRYTGPFTLSEANGTATVVKAIAKADVFDASAVATKTFTADQPKADTPVIASADGETTFWPSTTVTITTGQESATIYYTTDGSEPTTASTRYTGAITLNETATVKAIAVVDGFAPSVVASVGFVASDPSLQPRVATHMFDDINYYDGTSRENNSVFYEAENLAYLRSKTTAFDNYADARFVGRVLPLNTDIQVEFVYDIDKFASVTANNVPGLLGAVTATGTSNARRLRVQGNTAEEQRVRIVVNSPTGAVIKKVTVYGSLYSSNMTSYTLRQSDTQIILPSDGVQSSVTYSSSTSRDFVWEGTTSSIGFERSTNNPWFLRGFEVEYMPNTANAAAPEITGDEAPFLFERTVTITSADEGASIYYTTDNSEPTESSTRYTQPFTINQTTTVKAIAVVEGKGASIVSSETFTKQATHANIRALRQTGTASTQFVTLDDAVVTWVSAAGDSITIQDNSAEKFSCVLLVQPVTQVGQYLKQNDHLSGIVYGTYSPATGQISAFRFYNDLPTITAGSDAPIATVTLDDIKAPAGNQSSGATTPYDNMDYLNQLVKYKVVVNNLSTTDWNDDGSNDYRVVNGLTWGDNDVQIFLPPSNDVAVSRNEEYSFTGVLSNVMVKNMISGHTDYGRERPFRTLRVPSVAYLTDASGRTMSEFYLTRDHFRFVFDENTVGQGQIGIRSQSRPGTFTYESSDPGVASVNSSGVITANGIGTATITVTLTETDDYAAATRTAAITVVGPAYQLENSDFETWSQKSGSYTLNEITGMGSNIGDRKSKSENVPNNFNSWLTGVHESFGWKYWTLNAKLERVTDKHEGTTGNYAVKISEGEYELTDENDAAYKLKVPGRLTNGAILVDDFYQYAQTQTYGLDERVNFAYTDYTEDQFSSPLTGLPDAVSVWVKGKSATAPVVNVDLHTEGLYLYPVALDGGIEFYADAFGAWAGELVASAYQELPNDEQWHEVTIPFTYAKEGERPDMALVFFGTSTHVDNAETGDYLVFDDMKFVYNSELETATFEGVAFEFDENGAATIQGDYNATKLALTSNGRGATIETAYDETTRVLTITVKGDDISVDPDNQHVYTVTFEEAAALEVEHETTITLEGEGASEALVEDVVYTAIVANAANGNKNITLKGIEASYMGMFSLLEGDLVITNVAVNADGTLDGSNATFTMVGEESSEVLEGSIVSSTLTSSDFTGVFHVVSTSLGIPLDLTIYFGVARDGYSYTRAVTAGRFGTICLPFAVDADGMTGVKAVYSVAGYVAKNGKPSSLVLKEETEMEAGVPYVFMPSASEVTFTAPTTAEVSPYALYSNGFYGSYARVEMDIEKSYLSEGAAIYLLSNNKLVKAGSGSYIEGNRGYFLLFDPYSSSVPEITETEAAGIKGVRFSIDNTTTGISELSIDEQDATIFNVAGQRLQRTVKGVNIVNGRKVLKK
jgi:hypothetical protein